MWVRIIGALTTVGACTAFGFGVAFDYRRRVRELGNFLLCLKEMELALSEKPLPLPELASRAGNLGKGSVYEVMRTLSDCLQKNEYADAAGCMRSALEQNPLDDRCLHRYLTELGRNLGRFDLEGQLQGLRSLSVSAGRKLTQLENEQAATIRVYRTLGIFGGMALAVLLI